MYDAKIPQACSGDTDAALWLIQQFVRQIRSNRDEKGLPLRNASGKVIPTIFDECLLDYFCTCFSKLWLTSGQRVSDLATVSEALNLTGSGKRGPKKKGSTEQKLFDLGMLAARRVEIEKTKPKIIGHSPLERAFEMVAKDERVGISRVRSGYRFYKAALKPFSTPGPEK